MASRVSCKIGIASLCIVSLSLGDGARGVASVYASLASQTTISCGKMHFELSCVYFAG
jgi:hypothetical protein